ncbi:MAG: SOS response-associated peptidase [Propioniciclava sp.]
MCGRFAASASVAEIVETFEIDLVVNEPQPRFNLAPTDPVPAVVERLDVGTGEAVRRLVTPRWGLVPSWSRDARSGARLINARSETVATKPAFRQAFARRRCLIPADGFYEWQSALDPDSGKTVKQPWFIRPRSHGLLVMAGVYEFWKDRNDPAGDWLTTCAVITTAATDALGALHDRMPMVVRSDRWDAWLDPQETDPQLALGLLDVDSGDQVDLYPVSRAVNSVRHDGAELVQPLA